MLLRYNPHGLTPSGSFSVSRSEKRSWGPVSLACARKYIHTHHKHPLRGIRVQIHRKFHAEWFFESTSCLVDIKSDLFSVQFNEPLRFIKNIHHFARDIVTWLQLYFSTSLSIAMAQTLWKCVNL